MSSAPPWHIDTHWAKARYQDLLYLCQEAAQPVDVRLLHLDRLLREVYQDLCRQVDIPFSNLYSRMTYVDHRYRLPNWLRSDLHQYRLFRKKEDVEAT